MHASPFCDASFHSYLYDHPTVDESSFTINTDTLLFVSSDLKVEMRPLATESEVKEVREKGVPIMPNILILLIVAACVSTLTMAA